MDPNIKKFVQEDKEWMAGLWQRENNILGNAKQLREEIQSNILVSTHPIGSEMLETMDVLIEEQESKIEVIEERIDEYEALLDSHVRIMDKRFEGIAEEFTGNAAQQEIVEAIREEAGRGGSP